MTEAFDIGPARQIAEAHMPSVVRIKRYTWTDDGMGNQTQSDTPEVVATTKGRRRPPRSGYEAMVAGQMTQVIEGTVLLPVGTDVQNTDILEVDGEDTEVAAVLPQSADYQAQIRVLVQ